MKSSHCDTMLGIALKLTIKEALFMKFILLIATILCTLLSVDQNDSQLIVPVNNNKNVAVETATIELIKKELAKANKKPCEQPQPKIGNQKMNNYDFKEAKLLVATFAILIYEALLIRVTLGRQR